MPALAADQRPYESVTESARIYNGEGAMKITGVIQDTRTVTLKDGESFMQIDVKTEQGLVPVHLRRSGTWRISRASMSIKADP